MPHFPSVLPTLAIALSLSVVGATVNLGQSAIAQSQPNVDLSRNNHNPYQSNEQSSNGSSLFGNNFNPMDLIHQATLNPSRGMGDFEEDTRNNINKAAQEFKRQQQLRLQNEQPGAATNPEPKN